MKDKILKHWNTREQKSKQDFLPRLYLSIAATTLLLTAGPTKSLAMQQSRIFSDLDIITTNKEKEITPPLPALKDKLLRDTNFTTQEIDHSLRVSRIFDALSLAKQKTYDRIDPFLKILVIPDQIGIANTDDLYWGDQQIDSFDSMYWSGLIDQSSLTAQEKTKLIAEIANNPGYLLKWRQAMAAVKHRVSTYDHPLFNIKLIHLDDSGLQNFNGAGLLSLQELHIMDNQLQSFDGATMQSLEILNLSNNQLQSFDGTDLVELKTLNLSNNQLQTFNGTGLVKLEDLDLSNNQIRSFDETDLENLQELYLSGNKLQKFNGSNLVKLQVLFLHSNQLQSFNKTVMPNLQVLEINNNPHLTKDQLKSERYTTPNLHT